MIMKDPKFFEWFDSLAKLGSFIETTPLTDRQVEEQYRMELLARFLVLNDSQSDTSAGISDIETFLNENILRIAEYDQTWRDQTADLFRGTFEKLNATLGENVFRRFNPDSCRFTGPFLLSAFEVIAIGAAKNWTNVENKPSEWIEKKIKDLWESNLLRSVGLRSSQRLNQTLPLAETHFS